TGGRYLRKQDVKAALPQKVPQRGKTVEIVRHLHPEEPIAKHAMTEDDRIARHQAGATGTQERTWTPRLRLPVLIEQGPRIIRRLYQSLYDSTVFHRLQTVGPLQCSHGIQVEHPQRVGACEQPAQSVETVRQIGPRDEVSRRPAQ